MPYAIELFFDETVDRAIRRIWRDLADRRLAPYLAECGSRPHVSVAVYEDVDLPAAEERLKELASTLTCFDVTMWNLGLFSSPPVVFYAPQVTRHLLDMHEQFHKSFDGIGQGAAEYYLPNRWVPHCALAVHVDPIRFSQVVDRCRTTCEPISGRVQEIGIVRYLPISQLCSFELSCK